MHNVDNDRLVPDCRVLVFDRRLFKDDKTTPLSVTMQPATIIRRYGMLSARFGPYPDLVDVVFDHAPGESRSHFTSGVKEIGR